MKRPTAPGKINAMSRRAIKLWAVALSLICLAMGVVWQRSFGHDYWWQISRAGTLYALKVRGGMLSLYRLDHGGPRGNFLTTLGELWIYYPLMICAFSCFVFMLYGVQRRRAIAGQCSHCGYDLRASPDRCPECGTARS